MSSSTASASTWEDRLYDYACSHVARERELVEEYRQLASEDSRAFGYLAGLILQDEERHHRLFTELAESIQKAPSDLVGEPGPIPTLRGLAVDRDRGLATTERFLELERADLEELKELERELRDVRDTTLWALIVELMRMDTEKHIRILAFVRERLVHGRNHR